MSQSVTMSQSTRRVIPRSRNGCAVCKSKRLKCDEAKPQCSRCQRLGISCPGYRKPLRWNTASTPLDGKSVPSEPESQKRTGAAIDSAQSLGQSPKDLSDLDILNDFTDGFTPISLQGQDSNILDSFFALSDMSPERQPLSRTSPMSTPGALTFLQLAEDNNDGMEMWSGILQKETTTETNVLRPYSPSGETQTAHYEMPLSHSLRDGSSTLVEYYFKEVCGMMSCYDSSLNPYRTTISSLWADSPSLYYVIQSMAAACLAEVSPGYSKASGQLGEQAVKSLWSEYRTKPTETSSLLALVMLGFSLCWHDPSKLGRAEFELLAEAVLSLDNYHGDISLVDKQKRFFFYNSLVYWKMLLSFVTDHELPSLGTTRTILPRPHQLPLHGNLRMPHPQTGLGVEIQELVAQVGSLVRTERRRIRSRRCTSRHDVEQSLRAIRTAEELQLQLCAVELPTEVAVVESGDDTTPTDHLLKAAEAYRCAGLLQLYRNFPDLLNQELQTTSLSDGPSWLEVPQSPVNDEHGASGASLDTWLTMLALHTLEIVQGIPMSSRSRSIQPLLLISICSELAPHRHFVPVQELKCTLVGRMVPSLRMKEPPSVTQILHGRRMVLSRLSFFEGVLAAKPIQQMLTLIRETWALMDEAQEDVYWMDVMMERGYETLMG